MHIAIITPNLRGDHSGWSRYARDIALWMTAQGHKVSAIVHETTDTIETPQYPLLRDPMSYLHAPLSRWHGRYRLRRILKEINPDIVHCIAEPYGLLIASIGEHAWKSCLTIHGTYATLPLTLPRSKRLAMKLYHEIDGIISVSQFTKTSVAHLDPDLYNSAKLEKRITVIRNGVNLSRFQSLDLSRSFELPSMIMSVGAVKERKGYYEAIAACREYRDHYRQPFSYHIYGDITQSPSYVSTLKHVIDAWGLNECITLHGSVDDDALNAAFARADLFMLLSKKIGYHVEGFGLVLLEASASGIPVIGPNTGGCPEAIDEGISGYICDPCHSLQVSERMADVLIQKKIERSHCRLFAEQHSLSHTCTDILKYYAALLTS